MKFAAFALFLVACLAAVASATPYARWGCGGCSSSVVYDNCYGGYGSIYSGVPSVSVLPSVSCAYSPRTYGCVRPAGVLLGSSVYNSCGC